LRELFFYSKRFGSKLIQELGAIYKLLGIKGNFELFSKGKNHGIGSRHGGPGPRAAAHDSMDLHKNLTDES
jgi:hypothetical protein